jgi:hypothetical protein
MDKHEFNKNIISIKYNKSHKNKNKNKNNDKIKKSVFNKLDTNDKYVIKKLESDDKNKIIK